MYLGGKFSLKYFRENKSKKRDVYGFWIFSGRAGISQACTLVSDRFSTDFTLRQIFIEPTRISSCALQEMRFYNQSTLKQHRLKISDSSWERAGEITQHVESITLESESWQWGTVGLKQALDPASKLEFTVTSSPVPRATWVSPSTVWYDAI